MVEKKTIDYILTKAITNNNFGNVEEKCSISDKVTNFEVNDYPNSNDEINDNWVKQNDAQLEIDYNRKDRNYVHYYSKNTYEVINNMLWDNDKWKKGVKSGLYDDQEWYDEMVTGLDKVIEKSVVVEDTTVFRGGELPVGLKVGDTGKFKGFTSTSYNPRTAEMFQGTNDNRYNIKVRIPKGTHGVIFNSQFETFTESELLLGRNQKYVVLSVNDNTKEAEILLYD